jgi:hypothetical protein
MFGSSYGIGPLQASSFNGGIDDIQDALMAVNSQQGLPGMQQQPMLGSSEEEEEDEIQRLQKMFGGGGLVGDTLMGRSPAGKIGHTIMGSPMGMGGGGGLMGMLGGLFG